MSTITLTEKNFDREVNQSDLPVLVSYEDSNFPNAAAPVDGISSRLSGVMKCCKINVGTDPGLASKHKVRSVPTIQLFKDGKITDTIVGTMKTEQLLKILQ